MRTLTQRLSKPVCWCVWLITYYFDYHQDGRDASEERHVRPAGDIGSQSSEAVAPLGGVLGVGSARLRVHFGWKVRHGLWDNRCHSSNRILTIGDLVSSSGHKVVKG